MHAQKVFTQGSEGEVLPSSRWSADELPASIPDTQSSDLGLVTTEANVAPELRPTISNPPTADNSCSQPSDMDSVALEMHSSNNETPLRAITSTATLV